MNKNNKQEALYFYDLLVDKSEDNLSEYLSISVCNDGKNTTIRVKTIEDYPSVYTTTVYGISTPDLQTILSDQPIDDSIHQLLKYLFSHCLCLSASLFQGSID